MLKSEFRVGRLYFGLFVVLISLFIIMEGTSASEGEGDKFFSFVYSYHKVSDPEQKILKEQILNSLMDDFSVDSLSSKLVYLGKRREDAVIRDLWPLVDSLESEVAAEAFLKVFIGDDREVSERFYSAIRRRFGEIAGVRQVQEALGFYWNPESAIQKSLAHGLLEKVRGEGFAGIFKTAYFDATNFEDAKAMFRLLAFQNNQEAFFAAISILDLLEADTRFSDDQKRYLISNLMVFFDSPEIEPFVLEGLASDSYWKIIGTVTALGNYGGVQVADSLRSLGERVERENNNRSNSDQMNKRNSILLKSIERNLQYSERKREGSFRRAPSDRESRNRSQRSDGSHKDLTLDELAEKYRPLIRLSSAGNDGGGGVGVNLYKADTYEYDDYIPMSIKDLNNNASRIPELVKASGGTESLTDQLINRLGDFQSMDDYIDFSNLWEDVFFTKKDGYYSLWEGTKKPTPTVYYAVGNDPTKVDAYAVQYWFFYYYNNWFRDHVGDWESVTIFFDRHKEPTEMCYSTHYEARRHLYRLVKKEDNGHPHVFVSNGGHGSYAAAGDTEYGAIQIADNHYGNN